MEKMSGHTQSDYDQDEQQEDLDHDDREHDDHLDEYRQHGGKLDEKGEPKRKRRPKKPFIPAGANPFLLSFSTSSTKKAKASQEFSHEPQVLTSVETHLQSMPLNSFAPGIISHQHISTVYTPILSIANVCQQAHQKPQKDVDRSSMPKDTPITQRERNNQGHTDVKIHPSSSIKKSHISTLDEGHYPISTKISSEAVLFGHHVNPLASTASIAVSEQLQPQRLGNFPIPSYGSEAITPSQLSHLLWSSPVISPGSNSFSVAMKPSQEIHSQKVVESIAPNIILKRQTGLPEKSGIVLEHEDGNTSTIASSAQSYPMDLQKHLREAAAESAYIALASRMKPSMNSLALPPINEVFDHAQPKSTEIGPIKGKDESSLRSPNWKSGSGNPSVQKNGWYTTALEFSPVPTILCEKDRILYANKAVCHLFGYLEPELVRMSSVCEFVDPPEKQSFLEYWGQVLSSTVVQQSVKRCVHKMGYSVTCLWRCRAIRGQNGSVVMATIQDVLQCLMHLHTSQPLLDIPGYSTLTSEIFRDAFVFSQSALAVVGQTDKFMHVNITFCDLLGYTRQELIEKYWYELLPWDEVKECRNRMKQCRQSSSGRGDFFECRCLRKGGSYHTLYMRLAIMKVGFSLSALPLN
eukprot:TRINITY_DN3860_c0_g1_i2.p1 TRINITY_DN3860_c0_g1~~TRINITY_DN3860_c0_g1_i2.p1  ORF type:complete len:636 (+),score=82.04 TRINITY_DN3860_c0_g1_i2:90-1997(+)